MAAQSVWPTSMKCATSIGSRERKLSIRKDRMDLFGEIKRQACLSLFSTKLALGENQSIFSHFKESQRQKKIMKQHKVCRQAKSEPQRESSLKLKTSPALKSVLSFTSLIVMLSIINNQVSKASSQVLAVDKQQEAQQHRNILLSQDHYLEPQALIGEPRGEKPKLIPLIAADSGYSENSSVTFLCTVSQGHHETLTFDWFKDGQLLSPSPSQSAPAPAAANHNQMRLPSGDTILENQTGEQVALTSNLMPQIDKNPDHSLLRISRVFSQHAGRYTCLAKNQFGQDSSSVNLAVNGNYIRFQFCPNVVPLVSRYTLVYL